MKNTGTKETGDRDSQGEIRQRSRLLELGIVVETVYLVAMGFAHIWHVSMHGADPIEQRLLEIMLFLPFVSFQVLIAVMCWKLSLVALWMHLIGSVWIVFSRSPEIIDSFFRAMSAPSTIMATAPYLVQPLIILGCIITLRNKKQAKKLRNRKRLLKGLDAPGDKTEKSDTESGGETGWYYTQAGSREGPLNEGQIVKAIRSGRVEPDTLVWQKGMPDWAYAKDTNLATYFQDNTVDSA